jgi:hypothetical protein
MLDDTRDAEKIMGAGHDLPGEKMLQVSGSACHPFANVRSRGGMGKTGAQAAG